jgi:hypothetical protein
VTELGTLPQQMITTTMNITTPQKKNGIVTELGMNHSLGSGNELTPN